MDFLPIITGRTGGLCEHRVGFDAGKTKVVACLWRSPFDPTVSKPEKAKMIRPFYPPAEEGLVFSPPATLPWGADNEKSGKGKEQKKPPAGLNPVKPVQLTLERFWNDPE